MASDVLCRRGQAGRADLLMKCSGGCWTILLALSAWSHAVHAQATGPTNEQLRHMRSIGDPQLSPDGRDVVVVIADSTADGGKRHLWLVSTSDGAPRQLTYSAEADKAGETSPVWMPDGKSILFLAHRGEHSFLFRLPMRGGEAKAFDLKVQPLADMSKRSDAIPVQVLQRSESKSITEAAPAVGGKAVEKKATDTPGEPLAADVDGYTVAPNGSLIAVLITDPQTGGEKTQKESKADADWVDHNPHGTRLYLLDPATGKLTVTAANTDVRSVAWSPDSTRLLVVSEEPNGADDLHTGMSSALLLVAQPSQSIPMAKLPPTLGAATWSKDGRRIVYQAQARQDAPPGVRDLYEYTFDTGAIVNLTDKLKGTLGYDGPLTVASGEMEQLIESGVDVVLARFPTSKSAPSILKLPVATVGAVNTNQRESGWVFLGNDSAHANALYFADQLTAVPRPLKLPAITPEGLQFVAAKRVQWKSDRFTVEGLLYLPTSATSGHRVPLVVEVHGGPTGVFSDRFEPFAQFLLAQGWAVLQPNPRGSTGYGAAFAAANKNDLGGGDYRDIMAGVDSVLKTEPIDGARMALIGYSYGGEMAGFVESRTDRFKAIVSAAPVIDQFSEYGTEKGSRYDRWFYGYPWEHHDDAWRQSPLAGVTHAKTPFMLLQGESDTTDPLGQSQEMYRALRQANVPVELITYPREDHGPLANGIYGGSSTEPWHGYDARQRIVTFLTKYLGKTTY